MKARRGITISVWFFLLLGITSVSGSAEFAAWAQRYAAQQPDEQAIPLGITLARARFATMADLVRTNPEAALAGALPRRVREQMPAEIQPFLERHVSDWADLSVLASLPPREEPVPPGISREIRLGNETFEAHVYGRRRFQRSKSGLWVHGIVFGQRMVLHESPLRKVADAERASACAVCGKSPSSESAEFAGKSYSFCSTEHAQRFQKHLEDCENQPGPAVKYSTAPDAEPAAIEAFNSWTMGLKKVLLMRVDFSDVPGEPVGWTQLGLYQYYTNLTEALARNLVDSIVNAFYRECSYGQTALTGTVTPVFRMPYPGSYYATNGADGTLMTHAKNAAQAAGYVVTNYDRIAVAFTWLGRSRYPNSQLTFAGRAQVGGSSFWLHGYFDQRVTTHELGHTYGLYHANLWDTTDGTATGVGQVIEYGDVYDTMGINGEDNRYEFNPLYKQQLDWIGPAGVATITNNGTYRVFRFDHPAATGTLALEIPTSNRVFWVAYRQKFTNNVSLMNGAYVFWGPWDSLLLDMTPGSQFLDEYDSALAVGQTLIDNNRGVLLSTVARGGTEPNQFLDIYVRLDAFPPRITQQPQNLDAVEGGSAVFTVGAQSTEAIHFQWLFNGSDLPDQNTPTLSIAGAQSHHAGNYQVIVANMFGSVTSSVARLTVTSPVGLAVESPRLSWRSGGNAPWILQSTVTHDGVDAAQSGAIGRNQESWMETSVSGPGLLTFWWKVSSARNLDYLEFTTTGQNITISGDAPWRDRQLTLPSGKHTLRWRYFKTSAGAGSDAAWVDEISYITEPRILIQPENQAVPLYSTVTFQVAGTSTGPLSYQWQFKGRNIDGATNAALVLTRVDEQDVGAYRANVRSAYGSVSSMDASLTLTFPPALRWVRQSGNENSGDIDLNGMAVDRHGNIFVTGEFYGTNDFGGTVIAGAGSADMFLAKYDQAGHLLWVQTGGGPSYDHGADLALDADGNCYVAGMFETQARFGPVTLEGAGYQDVFLASYDSGGAFRWARTFRAELARGITLDREGNIYVGGQVYPNIWTYVVGYERGFLAKYNNAGELLWSWQPTNASIGSLAVDTDGHLYILGNYVHTLPLGVATLVGNDLMRLFLAKCDTNGRALWVREISAGEGHEDQSLAVDGRGAIYVSGAFNGIGDFGTTNLVSSGSLDGFVARYDREGNLLWVQRASGPGAQSFTDVIADQFGNVFAKGTSSSSAIIGNTPIAGGTRSLFVTRLSPRGDMVWIWWDSSLNTIRHFDNHGLAIDRGGNVLFSGIFQSWDIGTNLTARGSWDAFLAKLVTTSPPLLASKSGGNVVLSWSTLAEGFSAQSSTTPWLPASWTALGQTPISVGGDYRITIPVAGSAQRFYRLRKP